jgi:protein subunit release factor A
LLRREHHAKKAPKTKEQILSELMEQINEYKKMLEDLKGEQNRINGLQLKAIPELVTEELEELQQDIDEVQAKYNELLAAPSA